MTHDFTHDELNLLCVYLADDRNDAISSLGAVLLEIEDSDMRMLCLSQVFPYSPTHLCRLYRHY